MDGRCTLVIRTEQGVWAVSSANDEARSKRGGYLLLGTAVPTVGTSKVPFYLQPAQICTDQSGRGKSHTHFPGKATRPA